MPFGRSASQIRWKEIEPCYVFHEVNAFRQGDDVIVDLCRYDSMFEGGGVSIGGSGGNALSQMDHWYRRRMNFHSRSKLSAEHPWSFPVMTAVSLGTNIRAVGW